MSSSTLVDASWRSDQMAPAVGDGNFLLDDFERFLSPRTTMVAITQMPRALRRVAGERCGGDAHARGIRCWSTAGKDTSIRPPKSAISIAISTS